MPGTVVDAGDLMRVNREGPTLPGVDGLVGEHRTQETLNQQNLLMSVLPLEGGTQFVGPGKARDWSLEGTLAPEEVEGLPLLQLCGNAGTSQGGRLGSTEDC